MASEATQQKLVNLTQYFSVKGEGGKELIQNSKLSKGLIASLGVLIQEVLESDLAIAVIDKVASRSQKSGYTLDRLKLKPAQPT